MPFNMFPFSNLHNLNMDWVLKKVKEALHLTQEAQEAAEEAAATVETYGTRLETAEGDIDALELRMGTAEDDIDALEALNLGTRMTAAEGDIDNLETAVASKANSSDVNSALAGKVDIATPVLKDPVKIQGPGTENGVAIYEVPGPVNSLSVHPMPNGVIDVAHLAPVYVLYPTSDAHAATKKYVDDQLEAYAEAPALYELSYNGSAWVLSNGKTISDILNDITENKRVLLAIENYEGLNEIYCGAFSYYQTATQINISTFGYANNYITGEYHRYDVSMLSQYNSVTEQFVDSITVTTSDFSPAPVPASTNLGMAYGVIRVGISYKYGLLNVMQPPVEIALTGSTPIFTAQDNAIYTGGILTSLTLDDYPVSGEFTIVFESGSTPTTTSFPATILGLETFAAEANMIYEINVRNGLAVWHGWEAPKE